MQMQHEHGSAHMNRRLVHLGIILFIIIKTAPDIIISKWNKFGTPVGIFADICGILALLISIVTAYLAVRIRYPRMRFFYLLILSLLVSLSMNLIMEIVIFTLKIGYASKNF